MNPDSEIFVCIEDSGGDGDKAPPHKKQRVETATAEADKEASNNTYEPAVVKGSDASAGASESAPATTRSVDVPEALAKLQVYLNTPKKTEKVIGMIRQLTEQKMDDKNAHKFVEIFDSFPMTSMLPSFPYFPTLCNIISIFQNRLSSADVEDKISQLKLKTLNLATLLRRDLNTDDTVLFTKTCKLIQANAEELEQSPEGDVMAERFKDGILSCMADAFKLYKRQWAKQPVDLLFRAAAARRLYFFGDQLDTLDGLTTFITLEQRASSSNFGPRTIRTYDSTAHPLRQKNVGILR